MYSTKASKTNQSDGSALEKKSACVSHAHTTENTTTRTASTNHGLRKKISFYRYEAEKTKNGGVATRWA